MTIEELIIKLTLDPSKLNSATPAATKQLKGLEDQGAKTEQSVEKLGKTGKGAAEGIKVLGEAFASMLAIVGGAYAIKSFIVDTITASAEISRLSKNLDMSAGELASWGNAAEQVGGSAQGMQNSLKVLSKAQTDLQLRGESGLIPYFTLLGTKLADSDGKLLKTTDIMLQLASAAQGKDRQEMSNIFAAMGFDEGTINLLLRGRNELELTLSRQKEYALEQKKFSDISEKMQAQLVGAQQKFKLLGLTLLQDSAPALEKVINFIEKVGDFASKHADAVKTFFEVILAGFAAVSAVLVGMALATPFGQVVLGIGAIATAIGLLKDDYDTWKAGGKSLIDWANWEPTIKLAEKGIDGLKKVVVASFVAMASAVQALVDLINGDFKAANEKIVKGATVMNHIFGMDKLSDSSHNGTWLGNGNQDAGVAALQRNYNDRNVDKANAFFHSLWHPAPSPWANKPAAPSPGASGAPYKPGALASGIAQAEGFNAKGKTQNRPQRNHNPGDMEYGPFARAHGAIGSDGRFAIFPDDETGFKAMEARLASGQYAGKTDAEKLKIWAPASENNTKTYAAAALRGIPGASSMAAMAGAPSGASTVNNDNKITNTVGNITINAPSGNGPDIARAFQNGMAGLLVAQSTRGVS